MQQRKVNKTKVNKSKVNESESKLCHSLQATLIVFFANNNRTIGNLIVSDCPDLFNLKTLAYESSNVYFLSSLFTP